MKRDFNTWVLILVFGMPLFFIAFISGLYFIPCGFNNDCSRADLPEIIHTPIPTLIPAGMPTQANGGAVAAAGAKCLVSAETLLSSWVNSGFPESEAFSFTDNNDTSCQASYADVKALFQEGNLWYTGAPACITCHNSDLTVAAAQMDLSSYAGIIAGSRRASADVKGNDILGGGNWEQSKLNDMLFIEQKMPLGRPAGAVPAHGPVLFAGTQVAAGMGPATPAPGEEVARPSNPGGPGEAVNLSGNPVQGEAVFQANCATCHGPAGEGGVPNPGSSDGTVPPLNPIDSTLVDANAMTYATNIDLFLQNGSTPAGPGPEKSMPAWGKENTLTQQQIADVIAYVISLNK
jgi:mono/diheme cytochrome c family protein